MPKFISYANDAFWKQYDALPENVRQSADKAYLLFKENPEHPSLHFKKVGNKQPVYSARISDFYRALCLMENDSVYWFWIGNHNDYDRLIKNL